MKSKMNNEEKKMEIFKSIVTNVLTALYQPFWFKKTHGTSDEVSQYGRNI